MELSEFIQDLGSRQGTGRPNTFTAQFQSIMGEAKFVRHDFDTLVDVGKFSANFRNHVARGRISGVTMTRRKTSVYLVDNGKLTDEERNALSAAGIVG